MFSVNVENSFSDKALINYGVPQGSILGPLLFFFYVSDMLQAVSCDFLFYVDDTGLIFQHKDINITEHQQNRSFSNICEWFVDNKLSIHSGEDKTKFVLFALLKLVSAIFHYFWKDNVLLGYFEWNTLKRNLPYSCFIFPLFHKHLFSPELPCALRLLKTSSFEKITVRVIETMFVTLRLIQINKSRREVNQQIKHKSR